MSWRDWRLAGAASLLLCLAAGCGADRSQAPAAGASGNTPRAIPPTCSITIAAEQVRDPALAANKAALTLTAGAADEPPEGPTGFDVMPDGGFLVADPVRSRLASFDSQGKFRWDLPI